MALIDGKKIAEGIREEVRLEVKKCSRPPFLSVIQVGEDPASTIYVENKKRFAKEVGIESEVIHMDQETSQETLIQKIDELNQSPSVDAILVQTPLPEGMDQEAVMLSLDPNKDVDGFHPINFGKLVLGDKSGFIPCTPLGILALIDEIGFDCRGKRVVIVGRSWVVSKPLALLLMQKGRDATVTIAHSKTQDLASVTREADLLIAATGSPHLIKKEHVKPGAVVIDVGITRLEKLTGDVHFEEVQELCSYITPVPKGVGPMTIAMLLKNTLKAYFNNLNIS